MALRIKMSAVFSLFATVLIFVGRVLLYSVNVIHGISIENSIITDLVVYSSFFILLAILNYYLAGIILNPLMNIIRYVDKVSSGRFVHKLEGTHRKDEFGYLSKGIDDISMTMADQLSVIDRMSQELNCKSDELDTLFTNTIAALAEAVDARDPYTASHSQQVAAYSLAISKRLQISEEECKNNYIGALLHDLGKIGVPESILHKTERLDDSEFETIKKHPKNGYEIVKEIVELNKRGVGDIVLYHHERVDGLGYPARLKGNEIPMPARIVAIADAFDAMTTSRSYRSSMDKESAIVQLKKNAGTQFDEHLVKVFIRCLKEDPSLFARGVAVS